ncbi:MAG: pyridoxal phosphate-dependent aminotransferase [Burkholderiales bacterium]
MNIGTNMLPTQAPFDASAMLSTRIRRIAMNPIIRLLTQVQAMERAGHKLTSFTPGESDFDTPLYIQEAAIAAMRRGETRYTPTDGTADLKEAVRDKFMRENGLRYETAQISVASGAKQIIFNALACTLNDGDEVIIPAPYWTTYPEVVAVCDGKPVIVPCSRSQGFKLQPQDLARAITPRTKWLILNSPGNPTGAVYSAEELCALAAVLMKHPRIMVMSDDMYEHLLYDGLQHATIAQAAPEMFDRTLTVNGASKTYAMTGWRIGYSGGPSVLARAMAAIQSQATSNPCSISQAAALAALTGPQDFVVANKAVFEERRNLMVELLNQIPGISCVSPQGAFYCFADCTPLMGKRAPGGARLTTDTELATYFLDAARVAMVQGAGFGLSPYLRLSYATSLENIEAGCRRIGAAVAMLTFA